MKSVSKRFNFLFAALISFTTASCSSNETPDSVPQTTIQKSSGSPFEESDRKQLGAHSFPSVASLCGALSTESLPTRSWKNLLSAVPDMAPQYSCMSSMLDFGGESPMGLATNITYYVNGVKADAANEVKLLVNDNNPSGACQEL